MTAWDISTAVYLQNFSVAAKETAPTGVFFKPDGTKMYVIGYNSDNVNEYDLGTPWDISTAVFLQLFSVAAREPIAHGLFFKPDGTKMYIVDVLGDDVNEYNLGVAWDVTTAVWLQLFSVAVQDTTPRDIFFRADGLKMYVAGGVGQDVNEYNLGVAWNVTTAAYVQNFSVAAQEAILEGLFFKPDGTKMYIVGVENAEVNEYDLGVAWNISTAVWLQLFDVLGQDTTPSGMFFRSDGLKMYIVGENGQDINEYDVDGVVSYMRPMEYW